LQELSEVYRTLEALVFLI